MQRVFLLILPDLSALCFKSFGFSWVLSAGWVMSFWIKQHITNMLQYYWCSDSPATNIIFKVRGKLWRREGYIPLVRSWSTRSSWTWSQGTANDNTKTNIVVRLRAPNGSEFLFGADSGEQQEGWVRQQLLNFSLVLSFDEPFLWYLINGSSLIPGEEEQVPH